MDLAKFLLVQPDNYVLYETCTVGQNEIQSLAQTEMYIY